MYNFQRERIVRLYEPEVFLSDIYQKILIRSKKKFWSKLFLMN